MVLKNDGFGGTNIPYIRPQEVLALLSIIVLMIAVVSYFVGQSNATEYHDERISKVETAITQMDSEYMRRTEIESKFTAINDKLDLMINMMRKENTR